MMLFGMLTVIVFVFAFFFAGGSRATRKSASIAMMATCLIPLFIMIIEPWRVFGGTTHHKDYSVYWDENGHVTSVSSLDVCFTRLCAPLDVDVYEVFWVSSAVSPPVCLWIAVRVMDPLRALAGEDMRTITPEAHIKQIIVRESMSIVAAANRELSEEEVKQLLQYPLYINGLVLN